MTATHDDMLAFGRFDPHGSYPKAVHPVIRAHPVTGRKLIYVNFRWEPHSVAFWDNRCTQHLAVWDYLPHVRSGFRVQVEDTRPQ